MKNITKYSLSDFLIKGLVYMVLKFVIVIFYSSVANYIYNNSFQAKLGEIGSAFFFAGFLLLFLVKSAWVGIKNLNEVSFEASIENSIYQCLYPILILVIAFLFL